MRSRSAHSSRSSEHVRRTGLRAITPAFLMLLLALSVGCAEQHGSEPDASRIDAEALLHHVEALSADSMEGRMTGTEGHARARDLILRAFEERGLEPLGGSFVHTFEFTARNVENIGQNIIGIVRGTEHPDRYIVFTAHYDHLGVQNDQVFNGADDNASGAAALLALAEFFREHPPRNSIIFAAVDAEELGLRGARAFVAAPPVPLDRIVMNVNADMIGHSEKGELYAVGTYHYPFFNRYLDRVEPAEGVALRRGHDSPDLPAGQDWTMLSDHGAFHEAGIPFIYFGVEDHAYYHKPTDTFDIIHHDFHVGAAETILSFLLVVDAELDGVERDAREAGRGATAEPVEAR